MDTVDADELDWEATERGETSFRRKRLASAAGGEELGCSLYELPPGGRSWPYHYHTGNEEALFVLAGSGSLRHGDETVPLSANDYVALPAGEAGGHRVVNDTDDPLRYLMVSTMHDPDVTVYPDSGKIGVFAGSPPGGSDERSVHGYYRRDDDVDYWAGEESDG
ncbi:cupin domain-containing protein [Haloarchaeobius sp. HRN-SO-5]|uniref:cupin domain-containing protein n=1 Tax=Haloarchaeobius sp. HRN-SO-5 TaxID=3446118 RepID=UPI003EB97431